MKNIFDITIVGAGPVGMFAGTYASMHKAKIQIIESLPSFGGQVTTLFPNKNIYDIPGYTKIKGIELIEQLKKQLLFFKPKITFNETMISFQKEKDYFKIHTDLRDTYSKIIILATGIGAFEPRKLKFNNISDLENKNIFYSVRDINIFKNKNIVITGGGNSAADWAVELSSIAKSIILLHRREQFRALEFTMEKIKKLNNVKILTPFLINDIQKTKSNKLKIKIKKSRTQNDVSQLLVDDLIINYGIVNDKKNLSNWDIDTKNGKIIVNKFNETSIPGIYAIGDSSEKINLIATGFGEAPIAITNALQKIFPNKNSSMHSTMLMENI